MNQTSPNRQVSSGMGQNPGRHLQTPDVIRADSANPTSSGGLRSSAMKELRERIQREREVKSIYFDIVSFIDFDIISFIESIVPFEFFVWSPDVLVFSGPHFLWRCSLLCYRLCVRAISHVCVCGRNVDVFFSAVLPDTAISMSWTVNII
jgi:hypothetical protein